MYSFCAFCETFASSASGCWGSIPDEALMKLQIPERKTLVHTMTLQDYGFDFPLLNDACGS